MPDPLYWRLVYADDRTEDEPDGNASILLSHPGAVELHITRPIPGGGREPIQRIPLLVDEGDGSITRYRPIFYRRRSLAAIPGSSVQLEATVCGRGAYSDNLSRAARRRVEKHGGQVTAEVEFSITLWASFDGQRFVDCPQELFDAAACENLILNSA